MTEYNWEFDENGQIQCLDEWADPPADGPKTFADGFAPGSVPGCRRAICECDKEQLYGTTDSTITQPVEFQLLFQR